MTVFENHWKKKELSEPYCLSVMISTKQIKAERKRIGLSLLRFY